MLSLPNKAHAIIEDLDFQHSGNLNPKYQPEPSLWKQSLSDRFNEGGEHLLSLLKNNLAQIYRLWINNTNTPKTSGARSICKPIGSFRP